MRADDGAGAPVALAVAEDPVRLRPPFAVARVAVALGLFRHHQLVPPEGAFRLAAGVRDALPQGEPAVDADGHPFAEHRMVAQGDGRDGREGRGQERRRMAQRAPPLAGDGHHHDGQEGREQHHVGTEPDARAHERARERARPPPCARPGMRAGQHDERGQQGQGGERVGEDEVRAEGQVRREGGDEPAADADAPADQPGRGQGEQDAAGGGQRVLHELGGEEAPAERAVDESEIQGIAGRAGQEAGARGIGGARPEDAVAGQDGGGRLVVAPGHARARLHPRVHDGREVQRIERPNGHGQQEDRGEGGRPRASRRRARGAERARGRGPHAREEARGQSRQFTLRGPFVRVRLAPSVPSPCLSLFLPRPS